MRRKLSQCRCALLSKKRGLIDKFACKGATRRCFSLTYNRPRITPVEPLQDAQATHIPLRPGSLAGGPGLGQCGAITIT